LLNGMKKIVTCYEENMKELMKMVKKKKNNHPKFRIIRFFANDLMISSDKKDMLNYLFDEKKDMRNSTIKSYEKLLKLTGKTFSLETSKNPFLFVESLMTHSSTPFKSFVDFLEYNSKNIKNVMINMMVSFTDSGNMKNNLLNMYKTMMDPAYRLDYPTILDKPKDELDFLSSLTLNNYVPKMILNEEDFKFDNSENKMNTAKKLYDI